jgi:hypothetical protein
LALAGFAQVGQNGTITGTVTDVRGSRVIGQTVLVRNKATKLIFEAPLSTAGEYRVAVPAGTYELVIPAITLTYLRYVHKEDITVPAGTTVRADIAGIGLSNQGVPGDDNAHALIRAKYAGKVKGPAPRVNGKPDLSGVWFMAEPVTFDSGAAAVLTPWAQSVVETRRKNPQDAPSANCLSFGPLPLQGLAVRVMHSRTHLMLLVEGEPVVRQVFLDGRPHPSDVNPTWMGHSVGRWDGDTLVVDTIGFNGKVWFVPPRMYPSTETLRLTERYRRVNLATMIVDYIFEDPPTFMAPYKVQRVWELTPGEEVMEYLCENNRYRDLVGDPGK